MTDKAKNIMSVLAVLVIVYLVLAYYMNWWPADALSTSESAVRNSEDEVCIQVLTPARNSDTGEVVEFPTPCDVPEGWEIVDFVGS